MNWYKPTIKWALFASAAWALAALVGCGSSTTVPVSGKISYNGQPLSSGTLMLVPDGQGTAATGQIQSDGTFQFEAVPGSYKVTVQVFPDEEAGGDMGLPGMEFAGDKPPIPLKYADPSTTDLTAQVTDSETNLDLQLKD